jgi:hypothetical protein
VAEIMISIPQKNVNIILIINGLGERVVKFVDYCVAWVSEWLSLLTSDHKQNTAKVQI